MRVACSALAIAGAVSLCARPAGAQVVLTMDAALARAREQAPQIVSARLALDETRTRLTGASLRLTANPEIDVAVGNRQTPDGRLTDLQVGAAQSLGPPGRRRARLASAHARIDQASAAVDGTARDVLRGTASAFVRALHAQEQIRLLAASEDLARTIAATAERRYRAGDIAVLDVNLARSALGRARAEREAGEADLASALAALRTLLRLDGELVLSGSLRLAGAPDAAALAASLESHPDIRALQAAIREAEADGALAATLSRPEYGLGLRYEREDRDHIVLGGLTVTLPLFSKGQEGRAASSVRARRLRSDLEAARWRLRIELEAALTVYERRAAAARALETEALPGLDENEALTARSFDAGQIGLPDVLSIRRELLDTRARHLSALQEAALARVDVDAAAAVLR